MVKHDSYSSIGDVFAALELSQDEHIERRERERSHKEMKTTQIAQSDRGGEEMIARRRKEGGRKDDGEEKIKRNV